MTRRALNGVCSTHGRRKTVDRLLSSNVECRMRNERGWSRSMSCSRQAKHLGFSLHDEKVSIDVEGESIGKDCGQLNSASDCDRFTLVCHRGIFQALAVKSHCIIGTPALNPRLNLKSKCPHYNKVLFKVVKRTEANHYYVEAYSHLCNSKNRILSLQKK